MYESAYLFRPSLYAFYKGVVIICANRRLPLQPCSLSILLSLPLSFLLSTFLLSSRNASSPLICSRNEDEEFQRESSSSADAHRPTPALPHCSLVPYPLPSLSLFLSYFLLPYSKLAFLILVCLSVLSVSVLPPPSICDAILSSSILPSCSLRSVPWQSRRVSGVCLAVLMSTLGHGWWRNKHL